MGSVWMDRLPRVHILHSVSSLALLFSSGLSIPFYRCYSLTISIPFSLIRVPRLYPSLPVSLTHVGAQLGSPPDVLGLRWQGACVHKCVGLMLGAAAFMHVSLVNIHGRGMCVRPSMFAVPVVTSSSHSSPHPSQLPSHVSHVFGSFCAVALWYAGLVRHLLGNIPGAKLVG